MMHRKLLTEKPNIVAFTNEEGGIIDDLIIYCIEENKTYMLVVNASNIEKDWDWISNTQYRKCRNS